MQEGKGVQVSASAQSFHTINTDSSEKNGQICNVVSFAPVKLPSQKRRRIQDAQQCKPYNEIILHCSLEIFAPTTSEVVLLYYSVYSSMLIEYTPTQGLQEENRLKFHKMMLKVAWNPSHNITLLQYPFLAVSDYFAVSKSYQYPWPGVNQLRFVLFPDLKCIFY